MASLRESICVFDPNIEEAMKETFLQPIHHPFKEILNATMLNRLLGNRLIRPDDEIDTNLLNEIETKLISLLDEIVKFSNGAEDITSIKNSMINELDVILHLPVIGSTLKIARTRKYKPLLDYISGHLDKSDSSWNIVLGWWITHSLGKVASKENYAEQSRSWIDEWLLGKVISGAFQEQGMAPSNRWYTIDLIKLLTATQGWNEIDELDLQVKTYKILQRLFKNEEIQSFLKVNRYKEILWYNKESFEELCWWLFITAVIKIVSVKERTDTHVTEDILELFKLIKLIDNRKDVSEYQVEKLLNSI